jgi:dipeptidyl aminopeptidase/acylaminoacyl peptidase
MKLKLGRLLKFIGITLGVLSTGAWASNEDLCPPLDAAPSQASNLIPRQILFGNPSYMSAQVSPDGSKISYLAPKDGVLNVYVAPTSDPKKAYPVTHDTNRGIRQYFWSYENQILYLQDKGGTEDWCLHGVDVQTLTDRILTPEGKVQAQVLKLSPFSPHEIIVGINKRDPQFHDIYHLDIPSGQLTLLLENKEFVGFDVDDNFQIRLASRVNENGSVDLLESHPQEDGSLKWEIFTSIPLDDIQGTNTVSFNRKGDILYLVDSRETNTSVLKSIHMKTKEVHVLGEDEKADISGVFLHPQTKELQGYQVEYLKGESIFFDPVMEEDYAYLCSLHPGHVSLSRGDLKDQTWIVAYMVDNGPVAYYVFHRPTRHMTFLFHHRPQLTSYQLASMHPLVLTASDGEELPSYLTLPVSADPEGTGRPTHPIPLVLVVHGGPHCRDSWGLLGEVQWLANRGYGVLQVNYRGSSGFGKDFIKKSQREWGGKMHQDLIDSVQWAIEEGIADPKKVAIYGGSYGGYATLCGLTLTPDVFTCGVDIVGISNLETFLENVPPYWKPLLPILYKDVGDPHTPEGRSFLKERSPVTHVEKIKKPLLIGQGDNDPRVKKVESDQIVAAMKAKGIPVTYVRYPDEGHGFARPANRLSFYAIAEQFLARFLGGQAEPVKDNWEDSSIIVQEGESYVS